MTLMTSATNLATENRVNPHHWLKTFGGKLEPIESYRVAKSLEVDESDLIAIAEKGEPVTPTKPDEIDYSATRDGKSYKLYPPQLDKIRELRDGLLERGFKQNEYSEITGAFRFTHTQLGVKVHTRAASSRSRNRIYVSVRDQNHSYGRGEHDSKCQYEASQSIADFLKRVDTFKGTPPMDKGAIQNLIAEEVKKVWWNDDRPAIKRCKGGDGHAYLTWESSQLYADQTKAVKDAWLDGQRPTNGDGCVYSQFTLTVAISPSHIAWTSQIGVRFEANIEPTNPWCTPENIVAVAKQLVEQDHQLYNDMVRRKEEHLQQLAQIDQRLSSLLPNS